MFSSPILSHSNKQHSPMNRITTNTTTTTTTKHPVDEKSKTIEQLKSIIEELQIRHERKERELLKRMGILYQDLQQSKKKMAHLIYKHQQQKKLNHETKRLQDFSTQTDDHSSSSSSSTAETALCPNCSTQLLGMPQSHDKNLTDFLQQLRIREEQDDSEQSPKYYTLQPEEDVEYISATAPMAFNQSLSSPSLSTTDRSSSLTSSAKHNESSSSAYNTAESLPSSTYSDEIESLERVLNAACTMYTTHDNLEHTIKLQEELFRQRLRLRGITVDDNDESRHSSSSEHLYDNIDEETSDVEQSTNVSRTRLMKIHPKSPKTSSMLSTDDDEQQHSSKNKSVKGQKVRFIDQYHPMGKRKTVKSSSRTNLTKSMSQHKRHNSNQVHSINKKFSLPHSSNMLTVTIT